MVKEKIIMRREIIMLIMMNAQVLQFYLNMTFFFLKTVPVSSVTHSQETP